jgi:hypothetical protein
MYALPTAIYTHGRGLNDHFKTFKRSPILYGYFFFVLISMCFLNILCYIETFQAFA